MRKYALSLVFAMLIASCGGGSATSTSNTTATTATTSTTTMAPTTTEAPTTTTSTTVPLTTTEAPTTTTVPEPAPGCMDPDALNYDEGATEDDESCIMVCDPDPPSFFWSEAEDKVATYGALVGPFVYEGDTYYQIAIQLVGIDSQDDGERLFLSFCLGPDDAGDPVIAKLDYGNSNEDALVWNLRGSWLPFDPGKPDGIEPLGGKVISKAQLLQLLEIGRLYPVRIPTEIPSLSGIEEVDRILDYNNAVVAILQGGSSKLPSGYGSAESWIQPANDVLEDLFGPG